MARLFICAYLGIPLTQVVLSVVVLVVPGRGSWRLQTIRLVIVSHWVVTRSFAGRGKR